MYINFWYPVGTSEQITAEKPFRTKILSLNFVAFRDQAGKAHVLSDTCVHRGGSLSKGWVKDDCVVWRYSYALRISGSWTWLLRTEHYGHKMVVPSVVRRGPGVAMVWRRS